ncbi:MAG: hypothetical protein DRJ50_09395 [Actinobacteria bacterium]|nr:MAG: hypothetical protein DRJ50_09395 [Actinomycetota bacterium]
MPIQIIGHGVDGPAKPFAVVERFFASDRNPGGEKSVVINGLDVYVTTHPNGNGEAAWNLPDGSQGYLRSRGLSRGDLLTILTALSPRAIDAEIPGFDYTNNEVDGLELVAEQMNTNVARGMGVGSQCRVDGTDYLYRVDTVEGDALIQFAVVIDRSPPIDVGMVNETVVIISGGAHPGAPTVSDVINADDSTWQRLLDLPGSVPFAELDSVGGVHGPVMYWRQRDGTESEEALIVGRLELDAEYLYIVEGPRRYPVLWEFGTRWRAAPPAVVLPDGSLVALGDTIQSGGGYHAADQLDFFTTSAAVEAIATRCADNERNEVAVVQGPIDR